MNALGVIQAPANTYFSLKIKKKSAGAISGGQRECSIAMAAHDSYFFKYSHLIFREERTPHSLLLSAWSVALSQVYIYVLIKQTHPEG